MRLECAHFTPECLKQLKIYAKLKCMNARKQRITRLALSLAFGIAVMSVPLSLILGGTQARSTVSFKSRLTSSQLQKVERALRGYYANHGVYPKSLNVLKMVTRDGWRRPLLYSLPDGKPLIESLGSDGKRGGVGLDADVSNRNLSPAAAQIPFWARLFEREAQGVTLASLICGLVAGTLFFAGVRRQTFEPKTLPMLGVSLVLSLALAVFGAMIITSVHIPSGH